MGYYDALEERRKKRLGESYKPIESSSSTVSKGEPIKNFSASGVAGLDEKRKQRIQQMQKKPESQPTPTPTVAPTPEPQKKEPNLLEKITTAVKNIISPQKEEPLVSPVPETTTPDLVKLIEEKSPDYKAKQDKYLKFPDFFPNPDFEDTKISSGSATPTPEGQKKLETLFNNPVETSIKAAQDFISYHPESFQFLADTQKFIEEGLPEDKFSSKIAQGIFPPLALFGITKDDPLHRGILAIISGVNKTVLGSSATVRNTFDQRLYKAPKNIADQGIDTVGQAIGGMLPYAVGGGIVKAAGIPLRVGLPLVFASVGQLSEDETATVQQRLLKIPVDAITGYITTFIPGTRIAGQPLAQFAGKTFVRANLSGGVFAGSAFLSSLIKGMNPEEASRVAASAYVTGALFYTVSSSLGYLADELLGTKTKQGSAVFTPDDLEMKLKQTGLSNTENGKQMMSVISEARKNNQNIQVDLQAFKQGIVYNAMGVDSIQTPEGKVAGGIKLEGKLTNAAPKLPGVEAEPTAPQSGVPEIIKKEIKPPQETPSYGMIDAQVVNEKATTNLQNNNIEATPKNVATEIIREYMNMPSQDKGKYISTQAVEELKGTGVDEMKFDDNGNITLYREGVVNPGEPNSFSLEKKFKNQEAYIVNKDEVAINTTSKAMENLYKETYGGDEKALKLYTESLKDWNKNEAEVIVIPKEVRSEAVTKTFTKDVTNYTSAKDFAQGEYTASPETQVGVIDSAKVKARDPIDRAAVDQYKERIQTGERIEPIDVDVTKDGTIETIDGSQRITAYQELGLSAPIVNRGSQSIEGLTTLGQLYQSSQKQPSKVNTEPSAKAVPAKTATVEANLQQLSSFYTEQQGNEKLAKAWYEVMEEMSVAEPGQRLFIDNPNEPGRKVIGVPSTFPKWVPEDLRRSDLFHAVLDGIADPGDIKYPPNSQPRKQALYDTILGEIDQRAGTDSTPILTALKEAYEQKQQAKGQAQKQTRKSITGGKKGKGSTEKSIGDFADFENPTGVQMENEARKYFGITTNRNTGLYITNNGEMLDGSGFTQGSGQKTRRYTDHSEINFVEGHDGMYDYMDKANNIRMAIVDTQANLDFVRMPNAEQLETLKNVVSGKKIYADATNPSTEKVISSEEFNNFSDLESWLKKTFKVSDRKSSSGIEKNTEAFAELENVTRQLENTKPVVEFPEIMRMAEELMGQRPKVQASERGNYRGYFRPRGKGEIVLKASLFKDSKQAAKTLAHEVGHLMDYLPDLSMGKGNLVGRIASLNNFLREKFSNPESEKKIAQLIAQRKPLQAERKNLAKNAEGKVIDTKRNSVLLKQIKDLNTQIKALQKTTILNSQVRKELLQWSARWRPVEGGSGTAADIIDDDYRASSKELYADAISGLFNDPERLKQEAPEFWKGFFEYINRKPDVQKNLFATWDLLNQGEEAVFQARDKAMNDAYKKAEEKFYALEVERQKRRVSLLFQIQTLFDDKNQAVINKVQEAQKKGFKIEDGVNPQYELAGLNYLDGKLKNYVMETFQPVFELAQTVPDGWNTLGKILQLERTINERGEMANPGGLDPDTGKAQLEGLEKATDPKDWKILQDAKDKFREAVQSSIVEAEKAGFYSPELIKEMKANPAYATFQVIDYLDTNVSPKVYKSVGTLKDIANPATSTVMKTISLMKAIERNKVKVDTMDLMLQAFPEEIQPAKTRYNGKAQEVMDPKESHLGTVITIRDGKVQGYYVDKYIANTLKYTSNDTVRMAAQIMRTVSLSGFYRPLFTGINLGFQSFNFVRDFMRYWKNVPDYTFQRAITSFPRAVTRYVQATPSAAKRALGKPDEVIKEMENAQILGLNFNDLFKEPIDPEDTQIERVLQKVGILEKTTKRGIFTPIFKVLEGVEVMGNFIETLPKVAGYLDLKDRMPKQELAHFVRTKIGSPDFRASGTFTPISNNIFLFSNAIKEGIKSDFQVATNPATRAGYWWKTILSSILPKFIMAGTAAGLFGKWAKDRMDDASEYDKANYTVVPLSIDSDGKTVYLRVPQDETGRLIGALTWKLLNTVSNKEAGIDDLMQIIAVGAGQFPNISPSFTGIGAMIEYMSGRNPYDDYRGRNVIPEQEFNAGFQYSFPIFATWLLQNQGLGIVIPSFSPENPTDLQRILNLPVLSNIAGRWIKVSNYGQIEKLKALNQEMTKQQAQEYIARTQAVQEAVRTFRASEQTEADRAQVVRDLVNKIVGPGPYAGDKKTQANNLVKKFNVAVLKGQNPETDAIIYAPTNDARVAIFKELKKNMSESELKDLINGLHEEKVISDELVNRLKKEL